MTSRPSCTTALQNPSHGEYVDGCLGCCIRRLVHSTPEARAAMLDRIQFAHGWGARNEAVKLIEIEAARIRRLRQLAKA
jgi:hypothetical protein